jgi:hypothetical protein
MLLLSLGRRVDLLGPGEPLFLRMPVLPSLVDQMLCCTEILLGHSVVDAVHDFFDCADVVGLGLVVPEPRGAILFSFVSPSAFVVHVALDDAAVELLAVPR